MAIGCSYNCVELPDHEAVQCNLFPKGGVLALGVLECDHEITDFSNEAQLQNAIDDGKLKIIKNIKGIFPPGEPQEGESPTACGSVTILDGFNYSFTFKDFNVSSGNDDFYEKVNARSKELIWFECKAVDGVFKGRPVTETLSWTVSAANVPELNTEKQFYTGQVAWTAGIDEFPTLFDAPEAIFT